MTSREAAESVRYGLISEVNIRYMWRALQQFASSPSWFQARKTECPNPRRIQSPSLLYETTGILNYAHLWPLTDNLDLYFLEDAKSIEGLPVCYSL